MAFSRSIPWDIYEEHLDEAAFLWEQWEQSLDAANYTLDDVVDGPEERLRAHLDGLVLGGAPVAEKLLLPALDDDDPGKIAAGAWALLHAEDADHLDVVFEALGKAEKKEARAAMARAFALAQRADLAARLLPRLESSAPALQAVIVNVVARRGTAAVPEAGALGTPAPSTLPLDKLLATRNPELLAAALRALGRVPDPDLARLVEAPLSSAYVAVRDAAIETGMVLGMRAAWRACNKLVARNAPGCKLALALLASGGEPVDLKTVIKRLGVKALRRDALWALGFAGTVEAAEAALGLIDDEELAPLAAEAFATITGAPMVGALTKVGETDNTSPPELDADDDAPPPVVKPEDDLPVPNAERVRAWWEKAKANGHLAAGGRYLHGQPVTAETLRRAIEAGPTWRRQVWCLEVAMRSGVDLDVGAWGRTQKDALAGFPGQMRCERGLSALAKI